MEQNAGPKILFQGEGWRLIEQFDGTHALNLDANVNVSITQRVVSVTLPKDFLARVSYDKRRF